MNRLRVVGLGMLGAIFVAACASGFAQEKPSTGYRPAITAKPADLKPFEYVDARVPFYPAGGPRKGDGEWSKMQKPLDAAESLKHLRVPDDFEVRLFAAEPEIGKPLAMAWDERGRLWLCETLDYPNELAPAGKGRDRIRICEDTDGDGRADRFTIFAEALSIPTSLAFCRGGVIVQNATETLYLKDNDGDDRADERRLLISGWGAGDTHGGVSNFRYALDNTYWGMQGYNTSTPKAGEREFGTFRMGFFRFKLDAKPKPEIADVEFIRSTNNNTWGLGFSEEGHVFGSTANGTPSVHMPIANRYYERVRGWSASTLSSIAEDNHIDPITDRVRQVDQHGGFTAAAGHALYTARNYPKEYWNRTAFVCEPTGHLVATFTLTPDGTTFRSRNAWNLAASDDEWTAPIMAEVGPDGNVWLLDWYNYIVQHNPTPVGFENGKGNAYETELRDKRHGRIYRLVPKGWKEAKSKTLQGATPEQLVATLRDTNMFWRLHAQRLLVERGKKDVVPALAELINDQSVDEVGLNVGVIHALWTLHGLRAIGSEEQATIDALALGLRHHSASVRRNVIQVLPRTNSGLQLLDRANIHKDDDLQIKVAVLLAISETPPSQTGVQLLCTVVRRLKRHRVADDRLLIDATICAAAQLDFAFLNQARTIGFLKSPETNYVREPVLRAAEHFARGFPKDSIFELFKQIEQVDPSLSGPMVEGLSLGWPQDRSMTWTAEDERAIVRLLGSLPMESQGLLISLAERMGSAAIVDYGRMYTQGILAELTGMNLSDERKLATVVQAVAFRKRDDAVVAALLKQITPRTSPTLAVGILAALRKSEVGSLGKLVVSKLPMLAPSTRPAAIALLLSRVEWTWALFDALDAGAVQAGELALDQKMALTSHPSFDVRQRARAVFARSGGLPNPDRQKVLEELQPLTEKSGDAAAGKLVFTKNCAKCHQHSGEGTKIGPDLTGMAVHPKRELLAHLIDPNRSVEGNFRVYTVVTDDGRVLTGLLASETKTSVELIDAEGKRLQLQREAIEELTASPKSLMPEGFEKQVTRDDIVNLLEFLTTRGKFFPLDLRKGATAVSTRGMFVDPDATAERLIFPDWSPKTFSGVPFTLVDPQGTRTANVVMLYGPQGYLPPKMPNSVKLACNAPAKAIHLLSGVSGWGYPAGDDESVSMIVRLHYDDGKTEDHPLLNGVHFADYIRRVDVPKSQFAFDLAGRQIRYLAIVPQRPDVIREVEFLKGPDRSAPVVMAATVEAR
ncbi:MAG: c-type cytochrome [Planctomycetia bacterium]|nr:c-type cytochrome [Planctomycetia bacterium]